MRRWMNQGTTMRFNNVEQDIECCSKYGFEAIELKYNLIRSLDLARIKDLLQSSGVLAGSIGAVQLPIMQDNEAKLLMEEKLNSLCRCAQALQAEHIIVIPPRGAENADWHMIEEDAVKILEKYCGVADGYKVKLALEATGFSDSCINNFEQGLQIIRHLKKDNLGLVYDFYHALGMEDLGRGILAAEPKDIFIVHINDGMKCNAGGYSDDDRLWPGDGDADIKNQVEMLRGIGYQGPFSLEVYQAEKWPFDIKECYKTAYDRMNAIGELLM